jgi:hypothetical protein
MANQVARGPAAGTPVAYDPDFTKALLGGLTESRVVIQAAGGKPYLRLLRDGHWAYGQGDTEVQEGSHWAINVRTLAWGWVCWTNRPAGQKNEKLGQVMGPMTASRPPKPEPIEGWQFSEAVAFEALCLDGEDVGTEVLYMGNSVGAMRAFTKLRDDIIAQLQLNPAAPCPVVTLEQEDYKHNSYGKIYNPIFNVTGWADLNGVVAAPGQVGGLVQGTAQAAVAAPAEPARKRRAALGATGADLEKAAQQEAQRAAYAKARAEQEEADAAEDARSAQGVPEAPVAPTQQAHTGQRRRHRS